MMEANQPENSAGLGKASGKRKQRRRVKSLRSVLKLGDRFAERGLQLDELEGLDVSDPTHDRLFEPPELSPQIWALFEGKSLDRKDIQRVEQTPPMPEPDRAKGPPPPAGQVGCRVLDILLVEDNPGHVRLMQEALKESNVEFHMHVVEDGMEAMAFLRREGKYAGASRPQLILLDLNLPRKDGRDVLAEIKTDKNLESIPVVILTASTDEEDVRTSYCLQANCYISKPTNLSEFANVVKMIENFWGSFARLP